MQDKPIFNKTAQTDTHKKRRIPPKGIYAHAFYKQTILTYSLNSGKCQKSHFFDQKEARFFHLGHNACKIQVTYIEKQGTKFR